LAEGGGFADWYRWVVEWFADQKGVLGKWGISDWYLVENCGASTGMAGESDGNRVDGIKVTK